MRMFQNIYSCIKHVKKQGSFYSQYANRYPCTRMKLDEALDMVIFCCLALVNIANCHIQGSVFYALTSGIGTRM
jgi:hypothetical protein